MKREWTPAEVALWCFALVVWIAAGILAFLSDVGPWPVFVASVTLFAVLSLRYRAEIKRGKSQR